MPNPTELLRDIHEANLMYLLLLQRIARSGDAVELSRLQMSPKASQWLAELEPAALTRLARSSVLLAQLKLAPHVLLSALSQGMDATLAERNPLASPAPPSLVRR